jgi:hypothetical protein
MITQDKGDWKDISANGKGGCASLKRAAGLASSIKKQEKRQFAVPQAQPKCWAHRRFIEAKRGTRGGKPSAGNVVWQLKDMFDTTMPADRHPSNKYILKNILLIILKDF